MNDNIDDSIAASGASSAAKSSITFSASPREWLLSACLVLSVILNILCGWTIDSYKAEVRLKEWDLSDFKSRDFAELKARVNADELLFQTCKK